MNVKIIKSKRKTLSLTIDDELNVLVKAPYFVTNDEIDGFINSHLDWIEKAYAQKMVQQTHYNLTDSEKSELIRHAKDHIPKAVEYYSNMMNLYPTSVKITSAKKRFGSCSAKNSLCFSYFLMTYPKEAIDYVVVHELAHIKHHNHSKEFYALIEKYMPDYKERVKLLKN